MGISYIASSILSTLLTTSSSRLLTIHSNLGSVAKKSEHLTKWLKISIKGNLSDKIGVKITFKGKTISSKYRKIIFATEPFFFCSEES